MANMLLIIVGCCLCTLHYTFPFVPHKYKQLLTQSQRALEKQRDLIDKKLKRYSQEFQYPQSRSFGLTVAEIDVIKQSRTVLRQQLEMQRIAINNHLEKIKEKQSMLPTIKNTEQEAQNIQETILQQQIAELQEKKEAINRTRSFVENQMTKQKKEGILLDTQPTPSLMQSWSIQQEALDKKLQQAQSSLDALQGKS